MGLFFSIIICLIVGGIDIVIKYHEDSTRFLLRHFASIHRTIDDYITIVSHLSGAIFFVILILTIFFLPVEKSNFSQKNRGIFNALTLLSIGILIFIFGNQTYHVDDFSFYFTFDGSWVWEKTKSLFFYGLVIFFIFFKITLIYLWIKSKKLQDPRF
ncbi:hypothetical protein CFVI02298_04470 [Campylobacter fetus subsp. venerealis cfvi02/298]|nr:hypothetical protein CFVI03596_08855 [Campylobacter fetus subsp. venerealis cfvi03/596]OCS32838.1 hypothetical protein AWR31_08200 [Campylobacter fetus subsp. venerealis]OCS42591.1 hypothetical protein CFVI02298_04470 [Campylobacter fetus subsp. venerealis cfvi02/298]